MDMIVPSNLLGSFVHPLYGAIFSSHHGASSLSVHFRFSCGVHVYFFVVFSPLLFLRLLFLFVTFGRLCCGIFEESPLRRKSSWNSQAWSDECRSSRNFRTRISRCIINSRRSSTSDTNNPSYISKLDNGASVSITQDVKTRSWEPSPK